jgi:2-dehydropantoate 2-reductase
LTQKKLKIGFLGAGSIGSLFGGYLASIQSVNYLPEVIFFCRIDHANLINKKGLILHKNRETISIRNIKAFTNLEEFRKKELNELEIRFDYLFLTTKTYDIITAISEYKELIDTCKTFIILQNGIGNEEIIEQYCSKDKLIRIVTTNGALIEEFGHVKHTGEGVTKMGYVFNNVKGLNKDLRTVRAKDINQLGDLLNLAGLETIIVENIIKECWEKVFVNVGINAIGALTCLKNGDLIKNEGLKKLMKEAVDEAIKVAQMKKVNLNKKDFITLTFEVAEKTSENKNSMLQDILKHKRTEIDFINGKIVNYARELGMSTPINELLTYLVKGLEYSFN